MKMRYFRETKARIEIIPMIDIMLFLLVFFVMFSLQMIPSSGHVTKLPTSSTAAPLPVPKLMVEIESDGNLLVEGKNISPPQLTVMLLDRGSEKTAVTIAGSENVKLQDLLKVIDAIKAGGATQIALAARKVGK